MPSAKPKDRPRCGANLRSGPCKRFALANGKCRRCGGLGDGTGTLTHGARSATLRTYREAYEESCKNAKLLDPRETIAVMDGIVGRLMVFVEEKETPQLRKSALELKRQMDRALSDATLARRDSDAAARRAVDAAQKATAARAAGDSAAEDTAGVERARFEREANDYSLRARQRTIDANEASKQLTELLERGSSETDALEVLRRAAQSLAAAKAELHKISLTAAQVLTEREMVGLMSRIIDVVYAVAGPTVAQQIAARARSDVFGELAIGPARARDAEILETATPR